jgi:hypothetical protein
MNLHTWPDGHDHKISHEQKNPCGALVAKMTRRLVSVGVAKSILKLSTVSLHRIQADNLELSIIGRCASHASVLPPPNHPLIPDFDVIALKR